MNDSYVAWMKCNEIRDGYALNIPDYTSFHPGYDSALARMTV